MRFGHGGRQPGPSEMVNRPQRSQLGKVSGGLVGQGRLPRRRRRGKKRTGEKKKCQPEVQKKHTRDGDSRVFQDFSPLLGYGRVGLAGEVEPVAEVLAGFSVVETELTRP